MLSVVLVVCVLIAGSVATARQDASLQVILGHSSHGRSEREEANSLQGSHYTWEYFLKDDIWRYCVNEGEALSVMSPVTNSLTDKNIVSTSAVSNDLTVHVHADLNDTPVNTSACLSSQDASGECTFRSAIALCTSHLIADERNCTIVMSPGDHVKLDSAIGDMPEVNGAMGLLSIVGMGASFSPLEGEMQFLHVDGGDGEFRFSISDCIVSNFGNRSLIGGAIFITSVVNSRIENCIFRNNSGHYGGAVYIGNSNSHVEIASCIFEENYVADTGGGMYIDSFNIGFTIKNLTFWNNVAFHGGGLFINNENVDFRMEQCYFDNNHVNGIGGGAFIYSNSVNFVIIECEFIENSAVNFYAGGLYLYSRNQMELHRVQFIRNIAMYGGGLNGDSDNDYSLINSCYFEDNEAYFGGAMTFYASHVFLTIRNTTFYNNYASISGGAMYFGVNNDDVTMEDMKFIDNVAAVSCDKIRMRCTNHMLIFFRINTD